METFAPKSYLWKYLFPYVRSMKTRLSFLLFLISIGLQAQIQLKVSDQLTGLPLENVRVSSGTSVQTSSASGSVTFSGENLRLVFLLEGYERLEKVFPAG